MQPAWHVGRTGVGGRCLWRTGPARRPSIAPTVASVASGGEIRQGGTITKSMGLQLLDHPARMAWLEGANVVRQS
ncbi:MAG: hypothetical protein R3C44_05780 [Chloroflexota bacterium]